MSQVSALVPDRHDPGPLTTLSGKYPSSMSEIATQEQMNGTGQDRMEQEMRLTE